ncbi:CHRD domain-containing protein [Catenovulum sediminis]|uniref:CHRD domain-containing protein n=1 Tax=Catenovulum sediminis TaxID=1740262 RepID=UPI00117C726D|nr:CHRD domain-containing protein [Catenovulum sediminis]
MKALNNMKTSQWLKLLFVSTLLAMVTACKVTVSTDDDDEEHHDYVVLEVKLDGKQEVPMVMTDAWGWGEIKVDIEDNMVKGMIDTYDIDATAAHIHLGFAGENGGVAVALDMSSDKAGMWVVPDTMLSDEEIDMILDGGAYINVHTEAHPSGEIRGQILPYGVEIEPVNLSGMQEVPAVDTDASAHAWLTIDYDWQIVYLNVMTMGIDDATMAHVHEGFAGSNGSAAITLSQNPDNSDHWWAEFDFDDVDWDMFEMGGYYINVHTSTVGSGELRGQIALEDAHVLITELSGDQEVPAVTTDASGVAALTVYENADGTGEFVLNVMTDITDASSAHIHKAEAGANGDVVIGLLQDAVDLGMFNLTGTFTADQMMDLQNDMFYINVHSTTHAGGNCAVN